MKVECAFLVHLHSWSNAYQGLEALQSVWLLMLFQSSTLLEDSAALEELPFFFPPSSTSSQILQEILILVHLPALRMCSLINKSSIDDDENKYSRFLGIMSWE